MSGFCLWTLLFLAGHTVYAGQANVFIYHRFGDSRYPSTNISLHDFRAHLDLLAEEKFSILRLGEVVDRLWDGRALPQRCAVITVDDAYRSFLTDAWPLLRSYGYPVTLFVSTDAIGGGGYLTWREIKSLQEEGVEIGNHSARHAYLLDRRTGENDAGWQSRVENDLKRSQMAFMEHLGSAPQLFAYPYGEYSPQLAGLVMDAGFSAAFGQQSGIVAAGQDLFNLPRFPMGGKYTAVAEFRNKLFMKNLEVQVVSPESNVISGDGTPKLRFYLNQEGVEGRSLRCFVNGQTTCLVRLVNGAGGLYEMEATQRLVGRRNKYTLTASDKAGKSWFWYSKVWVRPNRQEVADTPVPR